MSIDAAVRQHAFFEPREKDGVELEALGAVQRHQRDGNVFLVFVGVADERGVIEQIFERLPLLGGFRHGVGKLAQIFGARSVLDIVLLLDPVEIAGAIEHALDQCCGRHFVAFLLQRLDQFAEGIQCAGDFLARGEFAGANHLPERFAGLFGARFENGDGGGADSARRHIQHAQQRDIIFGMENQPHVGQRVANFGAFVKAESADHAIADAQSPQDLFKRARLRAGAIENGDAGFGIVAHDRGNLLADEFRFAQRNPALRKSAAGRPTPSVACRFLPSRSELFFTTAAAASRIVCVER